MRDGGHRISISGDHIRAERGVRADIVPYQVDVSRQLVELMNQVAQNDVHVEIARVYPFEEALEALARVQTRHTRGKIVLNLE